MAKPTIVTRAGKGSALTHTEADSNFTNLQDATISITDGSTSTAIDLNGSITFSGTNGILVSQSGGTLTFDGSSLGLGTNSASDSVDLNGNPLTDGTGPVQIDGTNSVVFSATTGIGFVAGAILGATDTGIVIASNEGSDGSAISLFTGGAIDIVSGAASEGTGNLTINNLTFPNADGTSGQVLTTNGSGTLSFSTPSTVLAGDLDVNDNFITNGVTDGNVTVQTNGTGTLVVDTDLVIKDGFYITGETNSDVLISGSGTGRVVFDSDLVIKNGFFITSETNSDVTILPDGTGKVVFDGDIKLLDGFFITSETDSDVIIEPDGTGVVQINGTINLGAVQTYTEIMYSSTTTTGTYAPDQSNGALHYVAMTGSMTINEFTSPEYGQTITLILDGTGGSFTLTTGASIANAGGSATLTDGGIDVYTITCVDPTIPFYLASLATNFS